MKQKRGSAEQALLLQPHDCLNLGYVLGILSVFSCAGIICQQNSCRPKPEFINIAEHGLPTCDEENHSKHIDISRIRTFSFLVLNDGANPVVAQPELSPDGITWDSFGELPYVIEAGANRLFVLQFFLRYARINYKNANPGQNSLITVWFQGQSQ
ncbi:MAG: DUF6385 domain-containing protein [Bacillota bacterium]